MERLLDQAKVAQLTFGCKCKFAEENQWEKSVKRCKKSKKDNNRIDTRVWH